METLLYARESLLMVSRQFGVSSGRIGPVPVGTQGVDIERVGCYLIGAFQRAFTISDLVVVMDICPVNFHLDLYATQVWMKRRLERSRAAAANIK